MENELFESILNEATSDTYTFEGPRQNKDGSDKKWVKLLKALVELDGHAKTNDVYEKAYGHPRYGNENNSMFAGLKKCGLIKYNPKTREIELTDKGYEKAGVDINYPTTKQTLSRLAAAHGGSTTFASENVDRVDSLLGYYTDGADLADNKEAFLAAIKKAVDDFCDGGSPPMGIVRNVAEKALNDALSEWGL